MEADYLRIFFAIEFSKEIKELLKSLGDELKSNSTNGNFTKEEIFHLTMKFIGEIESKDLEKLKKCLEKATVNMNKFKIRFTRLGEFPRGENKIIWIGVEDNDKGLINLFNNIENEIELAGYKREERAFRPHITLGREVKLKEGFNYRNMEFESQDMIVDKVTIMESSRVNGMLIYKPVYNISFKS